MTSTKDTPRSLSGPHPQLLVIPPAWQTPLSAGLERSQALIGLHVRGDRIYFAGITIPDFDLTHSAAAYKIPRTFASAQNTNGETLWQTVDPEPYLSGAHFAVSADGAALVLAGRDAQGTAFVRRLDKDDGHVLWHTDLPLSPNKSVAAMPDLAVSSDGSRIAFAFSEAGYEGSAYVQRRWVFGLAGDGGLLFSSSVPTDFETRDLELSGNGQRLFVADESFSSGSIRCLDASSGAQIWIQQNVSFRPTRLASSFDGKRLYAGRVQASCSGQASVEALDGDGHLLWSRAFAECLDALLFNEPTGHLFLNLANAAFAGSTMAIDASTGSSLWITPHPFFTSQPFYPLSRLAYDPSQSRLFVAFDGVLNAGAQNSLWSAALDSANGGVLWSRSDPITTGESFAFLAALEALPASKAVLGFPQFYPDQERDLTVRALAGASGALVFEELPTVEFGTATARAVGANFSGLPQKWEDLVYSVLETDSALLAVRALEPLTGALRWSFSQAGGNFEAGGPQRAERHLFATEKNRILCARNEQPGLGETEILGLYADTGYVTWRRSNPLLGAISTGVLNTAQDTAYFAARSGQSGPFSSERAALIAIDTGSGATRFSETWNTGSDQAELWAAAVAPGDGIAYFLGNRGTPQEPAQNVALLARDAFSGASVFTRQYDAASLGLAAGESVRGIALAFDPSGTALQGLVLAQAGTSARLALIQLSALDGALLNSSPVPLPSGFSLASAGLVGGAAHLAVCADLASAAGIRQAWLVGYAYGDPVALYTGSCYLADGTPAALGTARASEDGQRLCLGTGANAARLAVLDFATGVELWWSETPGDQQLSLELSAAPIDLGSSVYGAAAGNDQAGLMQRFVPEALLSGPNALGITAGGTNVLTLSRSPQDANKLYLLLGSSSGTQPGLNLDGQFLPLVSDAYLTATLVSANQGPFKNTFGVLDAQGKARMEIRVPMGLSSALVGTQLSHAALSLSPGGPVEFTSEATTLVIVP